MEEGEIWEIRNRFLAAAKDPYVASKVDYNILSVAALTLALILLVEVIRHRLDHAAQERPFFHAVLEGFYRELTTLGIVEFCLYLMASYYPNYDKGRKAAFGDVHFLIFETALVNSISTCLIAAWAMRLAQRRWVETEQLEVTHYVELRQAFDMLRTTPKFERHPQYASLLLQIKFHELRVQCLQAYRLPLQVRISEYLVRSQTDVLQQLVHVSTSAWLWLTGAVCVLYYGLGMIYYRFPNQELIGTILTVVYFTSLAVFCGVAGLVAWKMRSVFAVILNDSSSWDHAATGDARLRQAQLALFWGHRPQAVIHLIQFLQFGFAVLISTLLVFGEEINEGRIPTWVYGVAVVLSYAIFCTVTGHAIPQYTLCTSLGQLVNEKLLRETVARFRLQEAKQRELERSAEDAITTTTTTTTTTRTSSAIPPTKLRHRVDTGVAELVQVDTASLRSRVRRRKTQSEGVAAMASMSAAPSTDSAMTNLPAAPSSDSTIASATRRPRSRRVKSKSEGVSAMFFMTESKENDDGYCSDAEEEDGFIAPRISTQAERPPLLDRLRAFFLSDRYVFVSNVFGTIVALILLGERVEGFIQGLDLIAEEFVTLALPRRFSFWMLAGWLGMCLATSWLIIYLHATGSLSRESEQAMVAAAMDATVFSVCTVLFLVAEGVRCGRDSCLPYGSRLGIGLGPIEPFTALVCLRVFRHWVAGGVVRWRRRQEHGTMEEAAVSDSPPVGHAPPVSENTVLVQAWEKTVRDHPELVAKHGEFSGEILRVMLGAGLPINEKQQEALDENSSSRVLRRTSYRRDEGQEVVLSGDIAQSHSGDDGSTGRKILGRLPSLRSSVGLTREPSMFDVVPPAPSIVGYDHMFAYPNARLVRTMRRCDRMFLPLLNHWVTVDVVLTRFEMVYFESFETDESVAAEHAEKSRRAVVATKGGKGLRLFVAATGRRVVGRMVMKDVAAIHVERKKIADNESPTVTPATEFWKQHEMTGRIREVDEQGDEVNKVKLQDHLRIDSQQGQTLFLRFYSDVEDVKHHPEHQTHEPEGVLFKNNAFQWAQTISHLCGKDQLKQPLPHYGENNNDELRDFLVVAEAHAVSRAHRRGFDVRRRANSPRRSVSRGRRLNRLSSAVGRRPSPPHTPIAKEDTSNTTMKKFKSFSDLDDLEKGRRNSR